MEASSPPCGSGRHDVQLVLLSIRNDSAIAYPVRGIVAKGRPPIEMPKAPIPILPVTWGHCTEMQGMPVVWMHASPSRLALAVL